MDDKKEKHPHLELISFPSEQPEEDIVLKDYIPDDDAFTRKDLYELMTDRFSFTKSNRSSVMVDLQWYDKHEGEKIEGTDLD